VHDLLERSARLISGAESLGGRSPVSIGDTGDLVELADGVGFVESFANVAAIRNGGELLLVDVGSFLHAASVHAAVRRWTDAPLRTAVYTHGHVDHVGGIAAFEAEGTDPRPVVVAHERVPDRFERYRLTHGYNGVINQRQFRLAAPLFPTDFRFPDVTYRDHTELRVGDVRVELHHDLGETDDHTWVWVPERRILCAGDMFIWVAPNCGNPQKVQRYPAEWAVGLRRMAALDAELLLPGHGLPVAGADDIRRVLTTSAELLESLVEQSLALMNAGARLDELLHEVQVPDHLDGLPWLLPLYDEPEFVVRNIWRRYGGWYDGNPATLKPAPEAVLARELADLAGGSGVLADRAAEVAATGDDASLRLAGHLAELAALAAPDDGGVHRVRAAVFAERARREPSLMATGIFRWAAAESEQITGSG
jgi:alkyl sulfatase BDS1-like metallo-beta-lactamase superfamily hydrolase